jgi:hypothetical protein
VVTVDNDMSNGIELASHGFWRAGGEKNRRRVDRVANPSIISIVTHKTTVREHA